MCTDIWNKWQSLFKCKYVNFYYYWSQADRNIIRKVWSKDLTRMKKKTNIILFLFKFIITKMTLCDEQNLWHGLFFWLLPTIYTFGNMKTKKKKRKSFYVSRRFKRCSSLETSRFLHPLKVYFYVKHPLTCSLTIQTKV